MTEPKEVKYRIANAVPSTGRWYWHGFNHPRRGEFQVWVSEQDAIDESNRIGGRVIPCDAAGEFVLPGEKSVIDPDDADRDLWLAEQRGEPMQLMPRSIPAEEGGLDVTIGGQPMGRIETPESMVVRSRSVQRREAALRGEPMPTFSKPPGMRAVRAARAIMQGVWPGVHFEPSDLDDMAEIIDFKFSETEPVPVSKPGAVGECSGKEIARQHGIRVCVNPGCSYEVGKDAGICTKCGTVQADSPPDFGIGEKLGEQVKGYSNEPELTTRIATPRPAQPIDVERIEKELKSEEMLIRRCADMADPMWLHSRAAEFWPKRIQKCRILLAEIRRLLEIEKLYLAEHTGKKGLI